MRTIAPAPRRGRRHRASRLGQPEAHRIAASTIETPARGIVRAPAMPCRSDQWSTLPGAAHGGEPLGSVKRADPLKHLRPHT
jgi:hypothetical protein